jgi:hypothetical protein
MRGMRVTPFDRRSSRVDPGRLPRDLAGSCSRAWATARTSSKHAAARCLAALALAVAGTVVVAVPAQAAELPEWSPYRTAPFTLQAGVRCSFGLSGTPVRDNERVRTPATFPDGAPHVQEFDGPLVVRYTNTGTGASVTRDLTGRALVIHRTDGGFREVLEFGRLAVGLASTDPGGPSFFVLSGSGAVVTVRADGSRLLRPGGARVENICTTLAPNTH